MKCNGRSSQHDGTLLFSAADELMYPEPGSKRQTVQYTVNLQSENITATSSATTTSTPLELPEEMGRQRGPHAAAGHPEREGTQLPGHRTDHARADGLPARTDLFGSIPLPARPTGDTRRRRRLNPGSIRNRRFTSQLLDDLELANSLYNVRNRCQTPTRKVRSTATWANGGNSPIRSTCAC